MAEQFVLMARLSGSALGSLTQVVWSPDHTIGGEVAEAIAEDYIEVGRFYVEQDALRAEHILFGLTAGPDTFAKQCFIVDPMSPDYTALAAEEPRGDYWDSAEVAGC